MNMYTSLYYILSKVLMVTDKAFSMSIEVVGTTFLFYMSFNLRCQWWTLVYNIIIVLIIHDAYNAKLNICSGSS